MEYFGEKRTENITKITAIQCSDPENATCLLTIYYQTIPDSDNSDSR